MVSKESLAHRAHKFAVAAIGEDKHPVAVLAIVEGDDRDEASRFAFSMAREEVHRSDSIVTGVYEIFPERAELRCIAGYARFTTGTRTSGYSKLEMLVA